MQQINKWFLEYELDLLWRLKISLFELDCFNQSSLNCRDILGNLHENFIMAYDGVETCYYNSLIDSKKSENQVKDYLNSIKIDQFFDTAENTLKDYVDFKDGFLKIEDELESYSNNHILNIFQKLINIIQLDIAYFRSTRPEIVDYLISVFKQKLIENNYNFETEELLSLLNPDGENILHVEQSEWLILLGKMLSDNLISKHLEAFPWLASQASTIKVAIEQYRQKYLNDKPDLAKLKQEFLWQVQLRNDQGIKAQKLRDSIIQPELKRILDFIQKFAKLRLDTKLVTMEFIFVFRLIWKKIAKISGLETQTFLNNYKINDIDNLLAGKKLSDNNISARCKYLICFQKGKEYLITENDTINNFLDFLKPKNNISELKGVTASKGLAKGTVYVSIAGDNLVEDLKNFQEGNILVTGMTQPNMVPLMIKAAAIITDEGGLTSHAAVIARELGKPCIIATKIATKVLKNGDLVELDTSSGIIKILQKVKL